MGNHSFEFISFLLPVRADLAYTLIVFMVWNVVKVSVCVGIL